MVDSDPSAMPDIPIPILQEVFKQCFSEPLQVYDSEAHDFPWYLGHVCSQWRALFFSMRSTFWNRIEIEWYNYGPLEPEQFTKRIEEIVAFFLDRTCGAPFSFKFCMKRRYTCDVRPILMRLIVHSEQWEEVSIYLHPYELVYFCGTKGRLPLLKMLDIYVREDENTGDTIPSMVANVFEDAPRLTHVVLWDTPWSHFRFNWSSLTIVDFQQSLDIPRNILPTLKETVNLVELIIEHEFPAGLESELIHLPHLKSLSVDNVAFLTCLDTPFLQQLKIDYYLTSSNNLHSTDVIGAFLARSGIKLSTLVTKHGPAATVTEILRLTPEVDQLVLLGISVFEWLARPGTQRRKNLNILWVCSKSEGDKEGQGALLDAHRNPPGDVRDPSLRRVIMESATATVH